MGGEGLDLGIRPGWDRDDLEQRGVTDGGDVRQRHVSIHLMVSLSQMLVGVEGGG